jgi:hypothetical protein
MVDLAGGDGLKRDSGLRLGLVSHFLQLSRCGCLALSADALEFMKNLQKDTLQPCFLAAGSGQGLKNSKRPFLLSVFY